MNYLGNKKLLINEEKSGGNRSLNGIIVSLKKKGNLYLEKLLILNLTECFLDITFFLFSSCIHSLYITAKFPFPFHMIMNNAQAKSLAKIV